MSAERRKLWIDCDPGVDDAWAILMAARDPRVELIGLSTVAGNVELVHTTTNALRLVEWLGQCIPVHAGADRALLWSEPSAAFVHGRDGFGDAGLAAPYLHADAPNGALALLAASHRHEGALDLVALGPLTNLALAVRLDPRLPERIRRLVVMGGAVSGHGNTARPSVEFNFGFDAAAAHIVFDTYPAIELVDWEVSCASAPSTADIEAMLRAPTPLATLMHHISRATADFVARERGARWPWADPLAMLAYLDPGAAAQTESARVDIDLSAAERGRSRVEWGRGPVQVHRRFHSGALERAMRAALR